MIRPQIDVPQLIGKNVRVHLTINRQIDGLFMDDRGHTIVLRDTSGKIISIPWSSITYIEQL